MNYKTRKENAIVLLNSGAYPIAIKAKLFMFLHKGAVIALTDTGAIKTKAFNELPLSAQRFLICEFKVKNIDELIDKACDIVCFKTQEHKDRVNHLKEILA